MKIGALAIATALASSGCRLRFDEQATDASGDSNDATASIRPSCTNLAAICGMTGDGPCCETTLIPGGTYFRSYDVAVDGTYSDMTHPATVAAFQLDKYDVTVGRFRKFVDAAQGTQAMPPSAGDGLNPRVPGSGWSAAWNAQLPVNTAALTTAAICSNYPTWTDSPLANENFPQNCVSWYVASAFCAWDGGYLPTEAEWNFVSAGGNEQRAYPWSSPAGDTTLDCTLADEMGCGAGSSPSARTRVTVGGATPTSPATSGNGCSTRWPLTQTPATTARPSWAPRRWSAVEASRARRAICVPRIGSSTPPPGTSTTLAGAARTRPEHKPAQRVTTTS